MTRSRVMQNLRACEHQVAGHLFEQGKAGSLVDEHGHFYKPIQPGPRGDREKEFYLLLKEKREQDRADSITTRWNPRYTELLSYIINGGSFRKAVRDLANLDGTVESVSCSRELLAPGKQLAERVPTFSRKQSVFYKGTQRSVKILQKDEFGLVDEVRLEPHEIIWDDEDDEEPCPALRNQTHPHSAIDMYDWPIEGRIDNVEDYYEIVKELPFILRNAPLLRSVPKFFEVCARDGGTLLELEDVARSYNHPAIIDIKIGKRTWYSGADDSYIQRCKVKDFTTTQEQLGFKICGMQVFRHRIGGYWRASKNWCKTITESTIDCALESFVHNENGLTPMDVFGGTDGVIHQLSLLEDWFALQTEFHFFSSSLLILYEGNASCSVDAKASVRMVDFAHTFHDPCGLERDENYLEGLKSLKARLVAILNRNAS